MKIDEKVLTYFESCNSPVDKEGYLYKKVRRPGSGLQGTWLMYCFEKQTERVVRLSKVNKLRGDFLKTVFKFSFQNLCDISPPTGLPVSSNQLCKKLSTQGVCTAVSKTQLSHTHTGWDQDFLSEALVRAEGEPPLLQRPADRPGSGRSDCSGGLHRPAVRVRGELRLLAGVERAGAADVQVCRGEPGQSGELDQSPAVSQPQLPGPACSGHGVEVQRWGQKDGAGLSLLGRGGAKESSLCSGGQLREALHHCLHQTPGTLWYILYARTRTHTRTRTYYDLAASVASLWSLLMFYLLTE